MNNSIILMIKNGNFSGYYFYMNLNIWGDFQIYISVPLIISDSVCIFFNCMSVRYVYWDTLWILVLGFILVITFEDMWFYWNGYPFELFNHEAKWLRQRWKPYFIVFRFCVSVHTSLIMFTNTSDYILTICFTKYV